MQALLQAAIFQAEDQKIVVCGSACSAK